MSYKETQARREAIRLVPVNLLREFDRFVNEGEANEEFMQYLENDKQLQKAVENILSSNDLVRFLTSLSS